MEGGLWLVDICGGEKKEAGGPAICSIDMYVLMDGSCV